MNRVERLLVFASLVALLSFAAFVAAAEESEAEADLSEVIFHQVEEGQTLGFIALKYRVSLKELMAWNDLESIAIEPGKELVVKSDEEVDTGPAEPLPVVHVVRRGDTFEGIARQYGVRISQVRSWNSNINPRRLQIGQQIYLHIPGSDGRSVSYGRANSGRLFNGVAMEDGPGIRVRNQARAYGTQRVVNMLSAAGADLAAHWPDAPLLVVGSLSTRRGGPLRPHRSHQSGRDVDMAYFHRGNVQMPDFRDMTPETFDAVKNWHYFKTLIDTGEVQFIFVEHELQQVLYEYALSIGYTEEELEPLLQYPRGPREPVGIIRHARGHRNHFHLRFICGPDDRQCR